MQISKKCLLCNQSFNTDSKQNYDICEKEHIYKCYNCGKEIIITRSREDWYKRKYILNNEPIFCSNKCSINYNNLIRFKSKWDKHIDEIRYLYENTTMLQKDILSKFNLSISNFNKLKDIYHLNRTLDIKSEIYSDKNKKQYRELLDSGHYDEYKNKLSIAGHNYWNTLNYDQKQIRLKNYYSNKSDEAKKQILYKSFKSKMKNNSFGKSKQEDLLYKKLVDNFGSENVIRQYSEDKFSFDFKIKRESTNPNSNEKYIVQLIELNGSYYHNFRPFTNSKEDIKEYNEMINKGGQQAIIANKWRYTDIDKYNYCRNKNINFLSIYFDINPKPYISKSELIESYNKICNQKLSYSNISRYNDIIYQFCFNILFKKILINFKRESIYDYLINRIKYINNYGEGCHFITMLQLVKDFNKYKNINNTFTMHASSNIMKFIKDYNIKSIADPFAGWGQRLLGSLASKCDYIGCDINDFQINNLNNIYDFIKENFNIDNQVTLLSDDSLNIDTDKLNYEAIFTCPPYFNTEIYTNKGIENFSYEQYKKKFKLIFDKWIKTDTKVIGIQFSEKYEDCIDNLGYKYKKIPITKSVHHFNKNKKFFEYIYILEVNK